MTQEENPAGIDFSSLFQKNMKCVAESIKLSAALPIGSARTNFITCFPSFKNEVEPYSNKLLSMMNTLIQREGSKVFIEGCDEEEKIDTVVDVVNKILDRVKDNLDEMNGIKSNPTAKDSAKMKEKNISGSWNKSQNKSVGWKANAVEARTTPIIIQKVLEKPQNKFENKIDNSNTPFQPRLKSKPNSIKPLAIYLELGTDGVERYCHPYLHELSSFKIPKGQLKKVEPVLPSEIDTCCAVYVDNENALVEMMKDLKKEKELAVDLEHHSYRSYQGLTCLMQISTRKIDYVIDTLALRSKLHVLNEVFTDPNVVKVFHDATSDVIWLQKDLNLYVVNMFDTYLASLTLNFPRLSLAFLLKHYCNIEPDKRYQLYDWRIRPLSDAAFNYARGDTHYLLHVYDKLRNALIEKGNGLTNLLESVYTRSVDLCKKRYEKLTNENDYLTLYKQSKQSFDNRQMHALKSLYQWREQIARDEDESTQFVLPSHMLLQISEVLPREMQGILACCNPIPTLVRKNLSVLHQKILLARNQPADNKLRTSIQNEAHSTVINKTLVLSRLRCLHDFSHHDDFRDNLPTLLDGSDTIDVTKLETTPRLGIFGDTTDAYQSLSNAIGTNVNVTTVKFITPYERYRRTVSFVLAEEEKENLEREQKTKDDSIATKENSVVKKVDVKVDKKVESEEKEESKPSVSLVLFTGSIATPEEGDDIAPTCGVKRKSETLVEQVSNKKLAKNYDAVVDAIKNFNVGTKTDTNDLPLDDKNETFKPVENTESTPPTADINLPKRKRKNKKKQANKGEGAVKKSNFTPFDYAKVNYNKFVTSGQKNLKKLLNSKITFGANKKNRNKFQRRNQNRNQ